MEHLFTPQILVPLFVFGMPVAILWIKKHYAALEKGHIQQGGALTSDLAQRIKLLEADRADLKARVENLESIVCATDRPSLEAHTPRALSPGRDDNSTK
jgi:hypothetical protein